MKPEVIKYIRYSGLLLLLVLLQITLNNLLSIRGVAPDFIILGIVYIALREGQIPATVAGFCAGLLVDLYLGELVGISAFSKTIAGFAAGYFYEREKVALVLRTPKTIVVLLIVSLVHNIVFLAAYFRGFDFNILQIVLLHIFGRTLFTLTIGTAAYLILMRTGTRLKV